MDVLFYCCHCGISGYKYDQHFIAYQFSIQLPLCEDFKKYVKSEWNRKRTPDRNVKASANRWYGELRKQNNASTLLCSSLSLHTIRTWCFLFIVLLRAPAILLQYYITNIVYMCTIILVTQASTKNKNRKKYFLAILRLRKFSPRIV